MVERRYTDPCGIARALDRVGERWALLIARELLLGPKRFGDLARGLDGISANVLTQRLKDLEACGVVRHRTLGPPVSASVYELTTWGKDLEPVLLSLAIWGSRAPLPTSTAMSTDAFALSLRATYQPPTTTRSMLKVNLALDADQLALTVGGPSLTIERGRYPDAGLEITSDVSTMRTLIYANGDIDTALASGRLNLHGSRTHLRQMTRRFARPLLHPDATTR